MFGQLFSCYGLFIMVFGHVFSPCLIHGRSHVTTWRFKMAGCVRHVEFRLLNSGMNLRDTGQSVFYRDLQMLTDCLRMVLMWYLAIFIVYLWCKSWSNFGFEFTKNPRWRTSPCCAVQPQCSVIEAGVP